VVVTGRDGLKTVSNQEVLNWLELAQAYSVSAPTVVAHWLFQLTGIPLSKWLILTSSWRPSARPFWLCDWYV